VGKERKKNTSYLLWVEHSDDLGDGPLVVRGYDITAGGEQLQLERLTDTRRESTLGHMLLGLGTTPSNPIGRRSIRYNHAPPASQHIHTTKGHQSTYLWYCSLKDKFCHIGLRGVGGVDGDDGYVRIRVGSLKREVYFEAIFVVRRHGWDA